MPTCFGGVLALDGRDGYKIWEVYAGHEVNSLVCEHDLNGDNVSDCLAAGRFGTFLAINSVDGSVLWTFAPVQSMNCTKIFIQSVKLKPYKRPFKLLSK